MTLTTYINKLKTQNKEFNLDRPIITETTPYKVHARKYKLCTKDTVIILRIDKKILKFLMFQ